MDLKTYNKAKECMTLIDSCEKLINHISEERVQVEIRTKNGLVSVPSCLHDDLNHALREYFKNKKNELTKMFEEL